MVQLKHQLVVFSPATSDCLTVNLLLLLPYCFKLPLGLCLIRFSHFNHDTWNLNVHLVNKPWNLKIGHPATYLCLLTAAHQLFAFHPLPSAPPCLASLLYLSTISSLFLHSTSSALNFSSVPFLFFSASSSPSRLLWYNVSRSHSS